MRSEKFLRGAGASAHTVAQRSDSLDERGRLKPNRYPPQIVHHVAATEDLITGLGK